MGWEPCKQRLGHSLAWKHCHGSLTNVPSWPGPTAQLKHLQYVPRCDCHSLNKMPACLHRPCVQANLYNTQVRSLAFDRPLEEPTKEAQAHWLTRLLLRVGGFYSKESVLLRGARALYEGIQEQALDKRLLNGAQLPRSACYIAALSMWVARQILYERGASDDRSS